MELKKEALSNPDVKKKAVIGAAVVAALLTSFYFSNGGSISKLMATAKHPFDPVARQVNLEMGYSNPALVKQLKEGRVNLAKGITTPTYLNVGFWGKKDQERDEFEVKQTLSGTEIAVGRRLDVDATKVKIKATLVGQDGCADLVISHSQGESKICLSQDEEIEIPVMKSQYQIELEAKRAKQEAEWKARQEKWKLEREERMRKYSNQFNPKANKQQKPVYQSQGYTLGGY